MADAYIEQHLPTIWICLHCGKWHEDRHQLRDVSCFLNAREFNREWVKFDPDDSAKILEVRVPEDAGAEPDAVTETEANGG
jgi:hypothetical protein